MKEATGEANMTVITIVLIGLVAAAGAIFIPRLINNMKAQSCCSENGGTFNKNTGKCEGGSLNGKNVSQMKSSADCS